MEDTWTSVVGSDPSARQHNPRHNMFDTRVAAVISQELLDHPPYRIDLVLLYYHLSETMKRLSGGHTESTIMRKWKWQW
jgi:hypothetical protein